MRKLMILAILLAAGMAILDLTYQEMIKPDAEYPMANRNIQFTYVQSKNPR